MPLILLRTEGSEVLQPFVDKISLTACNTFFNSSHRKKDQNFTLKHYLGRTFSSILKERTCFSSDFDHQSFFLLCAHASQRLLTFDNLTLRYGTGRDIYL